MKIKNIISLLFVVLFFSCEYKEYADAEYPATKVYQPMALETVWAINEEAVEDASMVTPGGPKQYILDKANNKFIVPMGVVQAGITLQSFSVNIYVDHSHINTLISQGELLPVGTIPLPETAYTLPARINLESNSSYASFNLEIALDALTGANVGRKFAIAVRIDCVAAEVSEGLETAVIIIDTAFLKDLL